MKTEKTKNDEIDDVINRLKTETKTENGKRKYFSFGLSIPENDENETEINDLKMLIEIVKKKFGYIDVKNKTLITDLLIYVAQNKK